MVAVLSAFAALLLLLLVLRLSQRLTLRLKVLAGVTVSRQPQKSCPHLGHATDPFGHGSVPSDDHRCYLYMQRDRVDLLHQKSFCLSTAHHKCPWLMIRRPDAPPPLGQRLRGLLSAGPRQAWAFATATLRRTPAAASSGFRAFAGAAGRSMHIVDAGMSHLARAIGHVARDLVRVLALVLSRLGKAVWAVLADLWALTQRGDTAVAFLARAIRTTSRGLWSLLRIPVRLLASIAAALSARWQARREVKLDRAAVAPVPSQAAPPLSQAAPPLSQAAPIQPFLDERQALAELFPGLAEAEALAEAMLTQAPASEEPVAPEPPPLVAEPVAEPALASAAKVEPTEVITQRLEAPLARFEQLLARLETLVSDGVAALDRGQDELAYELFLKATEQPAKLAEKAAPELRSQHTSLMTRAWFWRAKTAETVEEVVDTLDQALRYEPDNLQIQAHLAWARQRLDREKHVEQGAAAGLQPVDIRQLSGATRKGTSFLAALGVGVRMAGGLMALVLAALWMTTAVMPALGRFLSQLPAGDELLLRRLILTVNATALPGQGHLPLPILNYDLGLSLPFVMAFSFVFTARGLMDGDGWARSTGLFLAGVGGWLCAAAVSNPDASRLGLALCVGNHRGRGCGPL